MTSEIISRALKRHETQVGNDKRPNDPCTIDLSISFFFDGFGHNEGHKSVNALTVSNLAKLYFAHIPSSQSPGVYRFYYEGLGARFPSRQPAQRVTSGELQRKRLVSDLSDAPGSVAAEAANRRVTEGVTTTTAIRGALKETLSGKSIAKGVGNALAGATLENWHVTRDSDILAGLTGSGVEVRINQALDHLKQTLAHQSLAIGNVDIAIFGYDRGAAIARGFANKLIDIYCKKGTDRLEFQSPRQPAAAQLHLNFLGLFDSVSSAAEGNPVTGQLPMFKASLKDRIKLTIPSQVKNTVHMAAVHDARFYMRIDEIEGSGDKFRNYLYPGCQEDVGGGLPPGCQGKSSDFAKLPARRMLAAAYRAGVPVYSLDELKTNEPQVWQVFQFSDKPSGRNGLARVEALYAAYREALASVVEVAVSKKTLQPHTVLWVKYLAMRYGKGALASDPAMQWAVNWLKEEVRWLQHRRKFGNPLEPGARWRPLNAEERELLGVWESALFEPQPLSADLVEFFDKFLHDGVALSRLQRVFSEFWKDMGDDHSLYLRSRAIEVVEGPGWLDRLQEIRERNRRDPKTQQRHADAQARQHQQDEAGRLARDADRRRAGISGYRETR